MNDTSIIGIDEVGLGSWAGPLVVCAFYAPTEVWSLPALNDSKKLGKSTREKLAKELMRQFPDQFALVTVDSWDIDKHGIAKVLPMAMERSLELLVKKTGLPNRVIVDGEDKGLRGAEYFPKADGLFPSVMAASVIAKVFRDDLMYRHAKTYPHYGFEKHVGYGTRAHQQALVDHGLCPLHRRSYRPMRNGFVAKEQ